MLEELLVGAEVADLLEAKTTAYDAKRSKPDPDIVDAAIERPSWRPEKTVMIGDTPYDVEAAARARVQIIGFRSGGWKDADLRRGRDLQWAGATARELCFVAAGEEELSDCLPVGWPGTM